MLARIGKCFGTAAALPDSMITSLFRFVRGGSLAVALSVAVVGAPAVAEASLWDDFKEITNPQHFVGKAVTGAILLGAGLGTAVLVGGLGAPVIVVAGLVAVAVIGAGFIAGAIYDLVADANEPRTIPGDVIPGDA